MVVVVAVLVGAAVCGVAGRGAADGAGAGLEAADELENPPRLPELEAWPPPLLPWPPPEEAPPLALATPTATTKSMTAIDFENPFIVTP